MQLRTTIAAGAARLAICTVRRQRGNGTGQAPARAGVDTERPTYEHATYGKFTLHAPPPLALLTS